MRVKRRIHEVLADEVADLDARRQVPRWDAEADGTIT